jgi:uncharacterized protein YoxC
MFFFISTICFVLLTICGVVILVYVIGIVRSIKKASDAISSSLADVSVDTQAFIHDVRESMVYRMFFGSSRKRKNKSK